MTRSGFLVALTCVLIGTCIGTAAAAPGDLDPSFNGTGELTLTPDGKSGEIDDVAIQSDGKVVLAGTANIDLAAGLYEITVTRLNPNGTIDQGFGTGGTTVVTSKGLTGPSDTASAVVIQGDGRILVAAPRSTERVSGTERSRA